MNLLLDTTIQIDRITGSKERKKAIQDVLQGHRLFCSTYVKGEFYSNIVNDLLTLFGLFLLDKDIGETGKRISERIFGRSQRRVAKLYANILEMCGYDVDEIEDTFYLYIDLIQDEFMADIEKLLDTTKCARAKQQVILEDKVPYLSRISCTKAKEICGICPFWERSGAQIRQILEEEDIDGKVIKILKKAQNDTDQYRGRNCMILGDTIITIEACQNDEKLCVCSSNKKDFQPICNAVGVVLEVPDYTWRNFK